MRIGVDFDNTLVCYDQVFHETGLARKIIPAECPLSKQGVRDYLCGQGREDDWTELQGIVYGDDILRAAPYIGAIKVLRELSASHELFIVSHKTQVPFIGRAVNLHDAARGWIDHHRITKWILAQNIYFELTKEEKLNRIAEIECDVFIDDLPEIFNAATFPAKVGKILFDPNNVHHTDAFPMRVTHWSALTYTIKSIST